MRKFRFLRGILLLWLCMGMAVSARAADNQNLRQTGASGRTVTLAWERGGQAVSYGIYYRYAAQEEYVFLKKINTLSSRPSITVKLPEAGRKYAVKIVPYDGDGQAGEAYEQTDCVTLPGKITLSSQKSYATSQAMKVYWKGQESAGGYEFLVQDLYGGGMERYQTKNSSSFTLTDIPAGSFFRLRIRGYAKIDGNTVYGPASYTYIAQQPRVKFRWASHSTVLASWTGVDGAASYQVYLSDSPDGAVRKVKTVKDHRAAIPGLSQNRKYYVYVTAKMRKGDHVYVSPKTNRYTFRLRTD